MLIAEARPAPQFVRLPVGVIDAALALGKGHTETLLRLARLLWGGTVLEGSIGEWCAALGIEQRTWQRHVPDLGRSGCLRYSQPQAGVYVVYGFPDDAAAYRAAWDHVSTEAAKQNGSGPKAYQLPGLVDAFFVAGGATILSGAVVGSPSPVFVSDKKNKETENKQQHVVSSSGAREDATKLSRDPVTVLSGRQLRSYEALRAVGMWAAVAAEFAERYPTAMIEAALRAARGGRNVAGLVRLALEQIPQAEIDAAWKAETETQPHTVSEHREDVQDAQNPAGELWAVLLREIEQQLPRATFDLWLRSTRGVAFDDGVLTVLVESQRAVDALNGRVRVVIDRTVERLGQGAIQGVGFVAAVA